MAHVSHVIVAKKGIDIITKTVFNTENVLIS